MERIIGVRYEEGLGHCGIPRERLEKLEHRKELCLLAARLLGNGRWRLRNEGVKLLGLCGCERSAGLLLQVLTDRTPASRLHRFLGGDFRRTGFERRNALTGIALLGAWSEDVIDGVCTTLEDPYYEVRAAACIWLRTVLSGVCEMAEPSEDDLGRLTDQVRKLLSDKNTEARTQALHTWGCLASPAEVLEACEPLLQHSAVRVREALLKALHALLDRFPSDRELHAEMGRMLNGFLLSSVAMHPLYPLRARYAKIRQKLGRNSS
ncbi:hypothetical protein GF402_01840 [Candidatus Fermentibacteria bacterium]|nr:hypothetical protein [Candidatus Fermentibacteria bacterium]